MCSKDMEVKGMTPERAHDIHKAGALKTLAEITKAVKASRGSRSWDHAGTMEYTEEELVKIADMLLGRGEYAEQP